MKIILQSDHGGFMVHAGDGIGYLWTPSPASALAEVADRLERFVVADLAARREGFVKHARVLRGTCPTCCLPAEDCVGVPLPGESEQ